MKTVSFANSDSLNIMKCNGRYKKDADDTTNASHPTDPSTDYQVQLVEAHLFTLIRLQYNDNKE